MDKTNNFYLSIISTDSLKLYPNNSTSDFSNLLAYPLYFDDVTKWEVCLCQVGYTSSVYNIESDSALTIFDFMYMWNDGKYGRFYDLKIKPGKSDCLSVCLSVCLSIRWSVIILISLSFQCRSTCLTALSIYPMVSHHIHFFFSFQCSN